MFRRCSTLHYCLSSMPHHCFSSTPHRCISISPEAGEVSSLPPPLLPTATPCLCSQPPRVPIVSSHSLVSSEFTYYILSQKLNPNSCLLHFYSVHSTAAAPSSLYCCRAVFALLLPRRRHSTISASVVSPSHSRRHRTVTLASPSLPHTRIAVAPSHSRLRRSVLQIPCHLSNFSDEPQLSSTSHCCIMKRLFC
ncbi:hypothetical protein S245_035412 [Arachis hypogaea]